MGEPAFRGTLLLLQNRTRRDPESYRDEFVAQLEHFKAATTTVTAQRSGNAQYVAVLQYLCHVCQCYREHAGTVARIVLDLLRGAHGSNALPHDLRTTLVKCAMLLRSRDVVTTQETFPVFFALLQERDKELRRLLLSHIVNDIRRVNRKGVANGAAINRRAQSYLFDVMDKDDAVQARCAQLIMIDLYRRRVWCDERTVEVMTRACFSRHTTIVRTALRFFLLQMPKLMAQLDADGGSGDGDGAAAGGGDADPGRRISKLKQKLKIVKKTAKRERVLQRHVRAVQRRYQQAQQRREDAEADGMGGGGAATTTVAQAHVDPIRLLRDAHQFVERLFARLQRTAERFDVRLLYLNVIARTVSEHEVVHLPLYAYLERYAEPSQLHATQLLALLATCVHRLVPPDAVEPLVRAIANHFVCDRASPDAITVGLNTIREVCKRQPLAMSADLLKDLVEYKNTRGERGVVMAARALLQLYREVYPDLLPAKLRVGGNARAAAAAGGGGSAGMTAAASSSSMMTTTDDKGTRRPVYGATHVYTDIPGLELLYRSVDTPTQAGATATTAAAAAATQDANKDGDDEDDGSSSSSSSSCIEIDTGDDTSDGEWVADSDADAVASDDVEGSYVDIASDDDDDNDDENEEEDSEACPRLVAVQPPLPSAAQDDTDKDSDDEGDANDGAGSEDKDDDDDDAHEDNDSDDDDKQDSDDDDDEDDDDSEDDDDDSDDDDAAWYEDLHEDTAGNETSRRRRRVCPADVATTTAANTDAAVPLSAQRILTDDELARLRSLQQQQQQRFGGGGALRGKQKARAARAQRAYALVHGVTADLSSHDVERFTAKKREEDKQTKIAQAQELRKAKSPFELRKRTKSKLNSTHGEHAKRGKLFQMTKRSQRVATKLKSSVADRATRAKKMKKKDVKFRIRRGWKA